MSELRITNAQVTAHWFNVRWNGQEHLVCTVLRGPPNNDWTCVAKDQNLKLKPHQAKSTVCFAPTPIQAIEGAYAKLDEELGL